MRRFGCRWLKPERRTPAPAKAANAPRAEGAEQAQRREKTEAAADAQDTEHAERRKHAAGAANAQDASTAGNTENAARARDAEDTAAAGDTEQAGPAASIHGFYLPLVRASFAAAAEFSVDRIVCIAQYSPDRADNPVAAEKPGSQ